MQQDHRRRAGVTALVTAALAATSFGFSAAGAQAADDNAYVAPDAPRIGAGYADAIGTADCDPCVQNIEQQLSGVGNIGINRKSRDFRIDDPVNFLYGAFEHNQGVGVLADTVIEGKRYARTALSFTANDSTGLVVTGREVDGLGVDGGHDRLDYKARNQILDITEVDALGDHGHPGGLATQGDMIAVAMESPQGDDDRAAVYFVRANGTTPEYVATHWLGGQPDGVTLDENSAATVGFTRRADGGFVMAVSGSDHGRGGVWWYVTDDAAITAATQWRYVDFWEPGAEMTDGLCNIKDGKRGNDCFIGAGGGSALVTGCDGQLYFVALTGTDAGGKDDEYAQILRVGQDETGEVHMEGVWNSKRGPLGLTLLNDIAFRWGAGANVLSYGRLALLSTERRAHLFDNDWVNGYMRIAGSNTLGL